MDTIGHRAVRTLSALHSQGADKRLSHQLSASRRLLLGSRVTPPSDGLYSRTCLIPLLACDMCVSVVNEMVQRMAELPGQVADGAVLLLSEARLLSQPLLQPLQLRTLLPHLLLQSLHLLTQPRLLVGCASGGGRHHREVSSRAVHSSAGMRSCRSVVGRYC